MHSTLDEKRSSGEARGLEQLVACVIVRLSTAMDVRRKVHERSLRCFPILNGTVESREHIAFCQAVKDV